MLNLVLIKFITQLTYDYYRRRQLPLLRDKDYFNEDTKEADTTQEQLSAVTATTTIIMTWICGFLFDINGRSFILSTFCIMSGLTFVFHPVVSPNFNWFYGLGAIYAFFITPFDFHPLVNDYSEVCTRGTAVALSQMGIALGTIISVSLLNQFADDIAVTLQWGIPTIIHIIFGIWCCFTVTDTMAFKIRRQEIEGSNRCCGKVAELASLTLDSLVSNKDLLFGLLLLPITAGPLLILETQISKWLDSFHDATSGPIYDQAKLDEIKKL